MKYRKKPVVIEAVQFTYENHAELSEFCKSFYNEDNPIRSGYEEDVITGERTSYAELNIPTLEGIMTAKLNDYIIKGVQGEFYPIKNDIFEATYEKVNESIEKEIEKTFRQNS